MKCLGGYGNCITAETQRAAEVAGESHHRRFTILIIQSFADDKGNVAVSASLRSSAPLR